MKTILILLASSVLAHAEWQNLWPAEAPGGTRPPVGTETIAKGGRISNVEVPQYFLYQPKDDQANGAAVVVFPGGGYSILAAAHEGKEYAEWLAERGYTVIVVKYRVMPNHDYQYPVPFLDARRAIRTVRSKAAEWNLKPNHIGVMGSSAGGHLASLCATRFNDTFPEETSDPIDQLSARPDFAILCYPVIAMDSPVGHQGSRNNLAGKDPTPELLAKLSTYRSVTKETPPTFLVHTSDDGVDCRNSLLFASALREHKVPFALHLFEKGGHGYGLRGKGNLATWPDLLDDWLKQTLNPKS